MASLPKERSMSIEPPFTYAVVDYFGRFFVRQDHSNVKRYGCLLTNIVFKAIHIVVVHSLNTDSYLTPYCDS